jgi:hypothetical protein
VLADADHRVVDRYRLELLGPGLPAAPIHHEGGAHAMHRRGPIPDDDALSALVATVRASAVEVSAASLDALPKGITSISLAAWDTNFPSDMATLRRAPFEARADSIMYRKVLDDLARARGWAVHLFDPKTVEAEAARVVGSDALQAPRQTLGAPWTKDHRTAFAATILVG